MKNRIDYNEKLAEHFTLGEMVRSATARRLNIRNVPNETHVECLRALCQQVLEPLRRRFGVIRITSGYRCPALNEAVGGVKNSQHMRGEAADIHCGSIDEARKMVVFMRENLVFDQLLLERIMGNGCCWIHVSYVVETERRCNRQMVRFVSI